MNRDGSNADPSELAPAFSRESLMTIDHRNTVQDSRALLGVFGVIVLSVICGILCPPSVLIERHSQNITGSGPFYEFDFSTIAPLLPANRFLAFAVTFHRSPQFLDHNTHVNCAYSYDHATWRVTSLSFARGEIATIEHILFSVTEIPDESIQLTIRAATDGNSPGLQGITLAIVTGTPDHVAIRFYFRSLLSFFSLVYLLAFVVRLYEMPFGQWHIEQPLTLILLVLHVFAVFPYRAYYRDSWNLLFEQLFEVYLWAYAVVAFEFSAWRARQWQPFSVFAPAVLSFCLLVVGLRDAQPDRFLTTFADSGALGRRFVTRGLLIGLLEALVIASILRTYRRSVTPGDLGRFRAYELVVGCGTAMLAIVETCPYVCESAVYFFLPLAVRNGFVLMMTYFHFPFAMPNDESTGQDGVHASGAYFEAAA
jgi:hypothetical protein